MIKGLYTSASGMLPQVKKREITANNVANAGVTGFKKDRLFTKELSRAEIRQIKTKPDWQKAMVNSTFVDYSPGVFDRTGNPLDMAIDGDGFFQLQYPDGSTVYSRDGAFKISGEGRVVISDGFFLLPEVSIPDGAVSITVGIDGVMAVLIFGQDEPVEVGQIESARSINPAGLNALGRNLYQVTRRTNRGIHKSKK